MNTSVKSTSHDPARMWNILCHLSALSGFFLPGGFLLGPLVVWLLKKSEFPSVDINGKEALNFQISFLIYSIASALLIFVAVGVVLLIAVVIADFIFVVIASLKASNGESYRYPCTIRFIK